jgi:Cu(I)/Ag(I) efflux system membrane fusion protein
MSMALIERVERSGVVEAKQIVTAPISGMLQTLDVRSGMTVASGATLARINGLASVWLEAAVPASQAAGIVPGTPLAARFAAFPGEVLHARVQAVLPEANLEARTLRVRAETAGHRGLLPGLVGEARLAPRGPGPQLLIPSEALIRTGTRELVIRALADGHFQAVEVRTGGEAQGRVAILAGLEEGWQVVVSGQFLIDSEASLKGVMTRLKSAGQLP